MAAIKKVPMHWHFYGKCGVSVSSIKYPPERESDEMHFHDFHELVIVREGTARHVFEGGSRPLFRGSFFVVPPGMPHAYEECRNLELTNVLFFPERLLFPLPENAGTVFDCFDPPALGTGELSALLPLLEEMARERREKRGDFEFALNACFMQLLLKLTRSAGSPCREESEARPEIGCAVSFLAANYANPELQVADLAAEVNLTQKTLERQFRKHTGSSPAAYLAALRLERAAEMLRRRTDRSITEIALRCGFSDITYFSRVFRKRYALSPREYRKM
ncbi:MAG: helix-turn-helix domain-containing protein [Lentisphaeria bacterium]|nr:helix-turn-helix domain-containing protein [Lentisphaeria bacterium]